MPEETKQTENNTRTKIKLTQSSKGVVQWEISTEYDTVEKSVQMMGEAIDKVKALIAEKGLKSVDDAA